MTSAGSPIPTDVLSLHLAGGTADECARLYRALGPPGHWLEDGPDAWTRAGLPTGRVQRLRAIRDGRAAQAERLACAERGIRLAWSAEPDFPDVLRELDRAPLVLAVKGRWPPPTQTLAVVGARAATPYGLNVTRRLAGAAARAGVTIVSGLARGIDRAAHEAALMEGMGSIAVLGNGLAVPYPPEHAQLQDSIGRQGTLISEFTLHEPPDTWTFPRRNRLIAALAPCVLVVEAGQRSGALITAGHALDLQRHVLAVPGPIDSEASAGTNRLIADGAQPILDVQDLLLALHATAPPEERAARAADPLLAALGSAALLPDELAQRMERPVSEVRAALVALELQGRVLRQTGGRFAAC